MAGIKLTLGLATIVGSLTVTQAQKFPQEDLVLCDCGIGDDKSNPSWSTSRQMNWYQDISWPDSAYAYPEAPDMAVEVPYNDGKYPWIPSGAAATMPNGDAWKVYIEDGTPDGFRAGSAVTSTDPKDVLSCWAYRGRPVSAAINKTENADAICWSAFVCNRDSNAPARPGDMGAKTSSLTTSSAAPATSLFSETPATPTPTPTGGEPIPTASPQTGSLLVASSVNPRFVDWQDTWEAFISKIVWDQNTGRCVGEPLRGKGYNITVECSGDRLDEDTHMTLLLIQALRDVGLKSMWFNQSPVIPTSNGTNSSTTANSTSWVVIPEGFSIQATDVATQHVVGNLTYTTKYDGFLTGPCSTCETGRFNADYFDPIIAAMQGSYPTYNSFTVQAECKPWMVCK